MQHLCRRPPYAAAACSTASRAEMKDFTCASDATASSVQPPRGRQQEAMHMTQSASSHHVPPWPSGQGVGLLIRRLRAQVPQGVLSVSLSALRWRLATGAVRRRLRCAPLSALPRPYPPRQTPASVCRWRPARAVAVPQTGPPLGCCCSSVASCALGHPDIAKTALWSLSALVLVHSASNARVH